MRYSHHMGQHLADALYDPIQLLEIKSPISSFGKFFRQAATFCCEWILGTPCSEPCSPGHPVIPLL
jgi:hypothetical protein